VYPEIKWLRLGPSAGFFEQGNDYKRFRKCSELVIQSDSQEVKVVWYKFNLTPQE
jgi:hypothetical protein